MDACLLFLYKQVYQLRELMAQASFLSVFWAMHEVLQERSEDAIFMAVPSGG